MTKGQLYYFKTVSNCNTTHNQMSCSETEGRRVKTSYHQITSNNAWGVKTSYHRTISNKMVMQLDPTSPTWEPLEGFSTHWTITDITKLPRLAAGAKKAWLTVQNVRWIHSVLHIFWHFVWPHNARYCQLLLAFLILGISDCVLPFLQEQIV